MRLTNRSYLKFFRGAVLFSAGMLFEAGIIAIKRGDAPNGVFDIAIVAAMFAMLLTEEQT